MPTANVHHAAHMRSNKRVRIAFVATTAFGLWIAVGFGLQNNDNPTNERHFTYTNPTLDYAVWDAIMSSKDINLEPILSWYIAQKILANQTTHISVYFRNLNNWNRFGINEKEVFSPASLMKLPLLMAYLKGLQNEPGIFNIKLPFTTKIEETHYKQDILPEKQIEVWKEYTVKELIEYMIMYSDNQAAALLEQHVPPQAYHNVFLDNGFPFPEQVTSDGDLQIKITDYASLFRILFNASYINKDLSEYALRLLSKTTFTEWLVAWVPKHIKIAHKFGERWKKMPNGTIEKQLHDCGIIYYPKHPYILCVMTRWYDRNILKQTVAAISQLIYQKIDNQYTGTTGAATTN